MFLQTELKGTAVYLFDGTNHTINYVDENTVHRTRDWVGVIGRVQHIDGLLQVKYWTGGPDRATLAALTLMSVVM